MIHIEKNLIPYYWLGQTARTPSADVRVVAKHAPPILFIAPLLGRAFRKVKRAPQFASAALGYAWSLLPLLPSPAGCWPARSCTAAMGTRVHKLRPIELETPSVTELREASDPEGLFFMDGEEELRGELRTQEAVQTKKRLEWLLTPPESLVSLPCQQSTSLLIRGR